MTPTAPPSGSRLEVEGGIERAPCALAGPEYQNVRLTLRGADFEGLQGMSPADLTPAYASFVGKEQPIAVVCEIRDRAATILRNAGYIAAVQVPEQRIDNGVVHFRVLMAHLTQVRVRGNATGAERTIAGYLEELTKQPVFNRFEAERYLLLASDIPGYTVRLTLRPAGTNPGEVIGDVTVQRMPAYADFNVEDYGSKALGRWGGALRGQLFGLTGLGDRTTLSVYSTADFEEQQTVQFGHDFRVGPEGLTIAGTFTYSWAHPDIEGGDFRTRTLLGTLEVGYPFIRRQSHTLRGSFGMDLINQKVKLDGDEITRDKLRVAFARLGLDAVSTDFSDPRFSLAEPRWRFSGLLELRKGMDILGASEGCGHDLENCDTPGEPTPVRLEGRPDAAVVRFTGYGEFRPIPRITFALGTQAQYAWKPLFSFEEYAPGNYTVGRGYDPGIITGDKAIGTQVEVRFGSQVPVSSNRPAVEGFVFWDYARVWNEDRLLTLVGHKHLDSVGGGARVNFNRFALNAALAIPLTHLGVDNRRPDPRFLVSLTTRLWPWSYQ